MVKVSISNVKAKGLKPQQKLTSDLKEWLTGGYLFRCLALRSQSPSVRTGWPGVRVLCLREITSLILSIAAGSVSV